MSRPLNKSIFVQSRESFRNAGLQTGVWRVRSGGFVNADLKIGVPESAFFTEKLIYRVVPPRLIWQYPPGFFAR
jgi:hypothetical protein